MTVIFFDSVFLQYTIILTAIKSTRQEKLEKQNNSSSTEVLVIYSNYMFKAVRQNVNLPMSKQLCKLNAVVNSLARIIY